MLLTISQISFQIKHSRTNVPSKCEILCYAENGKGCRGGTGGGTAYALLPLPQRMSARHPPTETLIMSTPNPLPQRRSPPIINTQ
jgi:hypothetical protein